MPTQLDVVRQVILLAAQLRHLRKEEHGAFEVEKRRRASDEALRTNTRERVWEYLVKG
ncbi:MAG: hypothetical protein WAM58_02790 [Candidatus Acidiferrum sp.]